MGHGGCKGVYAVKKHWHEGTATPFYKAFLCDPSDPFILNSLGYISEFRGELEIGHQFYMLASMQGSNARTDLLVNLR